MKKRKIWMISVSDTAKMVIVIFPSLAHVQVSVVGKYKCYQLWPGASCITNSIEDKNVQFALKILKLGIVSELWPVSIDFTFDVLMNGLKISPTVQIAEKRFKIDGISTYLHLANIYIQYAGIRTEEILLTPESQSFPLHRGITMHQECPYCYSHGNP